MKRSSIIFSGVLSGFLLGAFLLLLLPPRVAAMEDMRLLRFPDINNDLVAFVYAGDIWTVSADGGDARRLTSHPGEELFPKISPDGQWIAFSGEYSGSRQIHVIPTRGGSPKQLTYYNDVGFMPPRGGWDNIPLDWTADGQYILFRAARTPFGERRGKYFKVALDGGLETPLPIPEGGFGTFSPDGGSLVFTPISRSFRTWKRNRAGMTQDVWTYDLVKNTSRRITTFTGTDHHPSWYKDKIYFVSDRDRVLNFWTFDLKTEQFTQVTHHKEFDVLWPSGHNGLLAYEHGGHIHILDQGSGATRKISVNIHFDAPERLPYFKNVTRFISRFGSGISPSGDRAVFDARGDIWVVTPKSKQAGESVQNLTRTQGIREMYPVWSPDGQWIAYVSDKSGDYEIYLLDPDRKKPARRVSNGLNIWIVPPRWSPNSQKLAFYDIARRLRILDVESGKMITADRGEIDDINDFRWSGDSRWLAYSKSGPNKLSVMWVYSLEQNKALRLSSGEYNDFAPAFSRCGQYLFFLSDRDFNMMNGANASLEFDYVFDKTTRIYAMALTPDVPPLFGTGAVGAAEIGKKNKKEKTGADSVDTIDIHLEGILDRVTVFPLKTAEYSLAVDVGGKIFYRKGRELRLYDLKTRDDQPVLASAGRVVMATERKKIIYRSGSDWHIADIKPKLKAGEGKLELKDLAMKIDPVKEWRQIYYEGWRLFRDWFYAKNMHGVDWEKIKHKYAQLLPYVARRADLDFILSEMVAELNVGHAYVNWGDIRRPKRIDTGLLGVEFKADPKSRRYIISKIYKGENWNEATRSPLTEPGVDVAEGDYLLSLNGDDVTTADNPYRFLENTAGKVIEITVNKRPTGPGARTSRVKPIKSEEKLFYMDWVDSRRRLVEKLSNGRIGYIHVPDTAVEGNREFFKGLYAYNDREAFIIDDRYNNGGWTPNKMVSRLAATPAYHWARRGLPSMLTEPRYVLSGPRVMLINYYSSSGGDAFPYWFRKLNLGKLIGTRTWGGLVGYNWSAGLVDGPSFAIPMVAIVNNKGEYVVEGEGVSPDPGFEVYDRPEAIAAGDDPSIRRAVEHLLKELETTPPGPKKPADPDRSGWHEKMKDKNE